MISDSRTYVTYDKDNERYCRKLYYAMAIISLRGFFNKETPKLNNANLIRYNCYLKNGQPYPSR